MTHPTKYALQPPFRPTIAPLTAAVSLALAASNLPAATITVDTLADGSIPVDCTLRDAIEAANTDATVAGCAAGSGADEIVFDPSLSGVLTLSSNMTLAASEITITGPGADEVTVSGGENYRLFTVNTAQGDLSISGLTLADGYATGIYGGAAASAIQDARLTLSDCVITNNNAASDSAGGAVLAIDAGLSVDNCEFSNNGVATVYTQDTDAPRGGNYFSSGGAILAYASPQVTISNATFYANEAGYSGGALAFMVCPDVTVDSSTIGGGNFATFGGGIAWLGGSQGSLNNSTVEGNYAFGGGGVAVLKDSSITIDNSEFIQNSAYSDGGGLLVGAVYGSGGGPVVRAADDSEPAGGTPIYGSAYAYVYDSLFRSNNADGFGGGAAAKYNASFLYINNGQIDSNSAGSAGGGPVASGRGVDRATISGSISYAGGGGVAAVYSSTAYIVGNSTVIGNEGGQGGGMLAAYGGTGVAYYSQIIDNAADYGGGVMAGFRSAARGTGGGSSYIVVAQSSLSNNQAAVGGGGLSLATNSAMIFGESVVSGNQAELGGGAAAYGGSLAVKYSEVDGNSANTYGGGLLGIPEPGCTLNVVGSVISGNDAGTAGGALSYDCEAYFGYSAVIANQASNTGGMYIYGSPGSPAELLNTTITNNTAEVVGGLYGGGLTADFVTVSHNLATGPQPADTNRSGRGVLQTGGAAFRTNIGEVQLENSIFAANSGPSGPRDLDILGTGSASVDYTLVQVNGSGFPGGTGNLLAVDPQLGALTNNGGPTPTRALPDSSPAVDAANPTTSVEFDQRGGPYSRVFGGRADMGAFEFVRDAIFSDRFEQP